MNLLELRCSMVWLRKSAIVCCFFLFIVSAFSCIAGGQAVAGSAPAAGAGATTPSLNATVDEVPLELTVQDKKHRPVLDLKPEEISVTDNDTPVKLSGFHLVKSDPSTEHVITLVFDHFDGAMAKNARDVASKVIQLFPAKGYSFAVLDFGQRMRLVQGFTTDQDSGSFAASQVGHAILAVTDKSEATRTAAVDQAEKDLIAVAQTGADLSGKHFDLKQRALDQTLLAALEDTQHIIRDQHARLNLAGLMALIRSQQKLSQRKTLIYFTQNTVMDSAAKEMVHSIAGAAARADVSVYTFDMDTLHNQGGGSQDAQVLGVMHNNPNPVSVGPAGATQASHPSGPPAIRDEGALDSQAEAYSSSSAIKNPVADLSHDTGGLYIDAQESLNKPLQQMLEDITTYYQASYISPIKEYDGTFHTIAIKSTRPGIQVHTRSGYFAVPPGAESGIRPFEVPLLNLFVQPQLPTEFSYKASILRFGDTPNGNANALVVEVPLSELEIKDDTRSNISTAHIAFVAEIKDSKGALMEHFGEDFIQKGSVEKDTKDRFGVLTMQRHFVALPGTYTLEVAVVDLNNQKQSAQRISFEIPPVASTPSMGDIVLVRKLDAIHEDTDPLDPMHFENAQVTANLSNLALQNGKPLSLFLMLHPDPLAFDPPKLQMEVSLNSRPGHAVDVPLHNNLKGKAVPYLATLGNGNLPSGHYEVKATLSQSGKSVSQTISFFVLGANNNAAPAASSGSTITEENLKASELDPYKAGLLAITVPTNPVPPPSQKEIDSYLADATARAVNYADSLPNIICVQVTNRLIDLTATGNWKQRDNILESLSYVDKVETHKTLEVNGSPVSDDRETMRGTLSSGEFGAILKKIFISTSKTEFHWKETDALGNGTVQVFEYKVGKDTSSFTISDRNNLQITVGFHGLVFIDTATGSIRRVTLVADDIPPTFFIHATSMAVDYDNTLIAGHDFLVPVSAEVDVLQGKHDAAKNNIVFRNYRRFTSTARIIAVPDDQKAQ